MDPTTHEHPAVLASMLLITASALALIGLGGYFLASCITAL